MMVDQQTFAGRYTFQQIQALPNLGEQFNAYDTVDNQPVLIKRPSPDQPVADMVSTFQEALDTESIVLNTAPLDTHPGVYRLLRTESAEGWWYAYRYLVFSQPGGKPLSELAFPLTEATIVTVLTRLADVLCAAQQAGYCHGAITSDTIYWDVKRQQVQVINWGQAISANEPDAAPDDMFRVGEALYLMLTGNPYERVTSTEWEANNGVRWSERERFPFWAAVLGFTLNPNPNKRYADAFALQADVANYQETADLPEVAEKGPNEPPTIQLDPGRITHALLYPTRLPSQATPSSFDVWLNESLQGIEGLLPQEPNHPELNTEYKRLSMLRSKWQIARLAAEQPDLTAQNRALDDLNTHARTAGYHNSVANAVGQVVDLAHHAPWEMLTAADAAGYASRVASALLQPPSDQMRANLYSLEQAADKPAEGEWFNYFGPLAEAHAALYTDNAEGISTALAKVSESPVRERHWKLLSDLGQTLISVDAGNVTLAQQHLADVLKFDDAIGKTAKVKALQEQIDQLEQVRSVLNSFVRQPAAARTALSDLALKAQARAEAVRQASEVAESCYQALMACQTGQFASANRIFERLSESARDLPTYAGVQLNRVAEPLLDYRDATRTCLDDIQQVLKGLQAHALPNSLIEKHLNHITNQMPLLPNTAPSDCGRPCIWRDAFAAVSNQTVDEIVRLENGIKVGDILISSDEPIYPLFDRVAPQPEPEPEPLVVLPPAPETEAPLVDDELVADAMAAIAAGSSIAAAEPLSEPDVETSIESRSEPAAEPDPHATLLGAPAVAAVEATVPSADLTIEPEPTLEVIIETAAPSTAQTADPDVTLVAQPKLSPEPTIGTPPTSSAAAEPKPAVDTPTPQPKPAGSGFDFAPWVTLFLIFGIVAGLLFAWNALQSGQIDLAGLFPSPTAPGPAPTAVGPTQISPAVVDQACLNIRTAESSNNWLEALREIKALEIIAPQVSRCDNRSLAQIQAFSFFQLGWEAYNAEDFELAAEQWQQASTTQLVTVPPLDLLIACAEARVQNTTAAYSALGDQFSPEQVLATCQIRTP